MNVGTPFSSNRRAISKYPFASMTALMFALSFSLSTAEPLSPSPESPLRVSKVERVAKKFAVGAVDTILLFDHLFRKSSTVVSRHYLDRVADPNSPFHATYLDYKQGRISKTDLVARLPHVSLIGDSLSKNFYITTVPSVFWRCRTKFRKNWFLDTDPPPNSIYSVYERIEELTPLVATDYARTGAFVTAQSGDEDFIHLLGHTPHFAGQVDQTLKAKRFPDLLLIWIGNNNLDWLVGASPSERAHPDKYLHERARRFGEDYARQLRRLISRAESEDHPAAIVAFGLVNSEAALRARQTAEALRAHNHNLFPYLEVDYRRCESMRPQYRQNIARFEILINRELKRAVDEVRDELRLYPKVRLEYSNAFSELDISNVALLNAHDAWHSSPEGHDLLAQTAFTAIAPSLRFLRIGSQKWDVTHSVEQVTHARLTPRARADNRGP